MARKERKYNYIYKITCLKNGKYYIGMHSTDKLSDGYMGGGRGIKNSVKKYGKDSHCKEILEFFPTREDLVNRESELVNESLIRDPMCMNIKLGGEGWCCVGIRIGGDGWKKAGERWKTEEGKRYLSEVVKKRWDDDEYRELISYKLKGNKNFQDKKHSELSKKKMSESSKGKGTGRKNSQFGKIWVYSDSEKINKKIKEEEFENLIKFGFKRGLKMEYFKKE
jgi:hypothetical protein